MDKPKMKYINNGEFIEVEICENFTDMCSDICNLINHCYNKVLKTDEEKAEFKRVIKQVINDEIVFKTREEIKEKTMSILTEGFMKMLKSIFGNNDNADDKEKRDRAFEEFLRSLNDDNR